MKAAGKRLTKVKVAKKTAKKESTKTAAKKAAKAKTKASTPKTYSWKNGTKRKLFNGKIIDTNDSLFEINTIDNLGRTNTERMRKGLAPIGKDGEPIVLHHVDQTENGRLREMLRSEHQNNYIGIQVDIHHRLIEINLNLGSENIGNKGINDLLRGTNEYSKFKNCDEKVSVLRRL